MSNEPIGDVGIKLILELFFVRWCKAIHPVDRWFGSREDADRMSKLFGRRKFLRVEGLQRFEKLLVPIAERTNARVDSQETRQVEV